MGNTPAPVVADTHVFIWYVVGSPKLSKAAKHALDAVTDADQRIVISAMSVVELRYLFEKGTLTKGEFKTFTEILELRESGFVVEPFDDKMAGAVASIPRACVCDPFDRTIAATALALGIPLVSQDRRPRELPAPQVIG